MSYPFELDVRQDVVKAAKLMHARGLIAGHDGNISVRLGPERLLCTPSGINKGFIEEKDLVVIDLAGQPQRGRVEPSSEVLMHLLVYGRRADVGCVIHAHPPHCVACTLVGLELTAPVVPETAFLLGPVPTARYATPGTAEVPESIAPFVADFRALLLERHGSLTVGRTVREAYDRLEALEHAAQVLFLARNLGDVPPLADEEVARLKASVTSRGLEWKYPEHGSLLPGGDDRGGRLADVIVRRVLARLSDKSQP